MAPNSLLQGTGILGGLGQECRSVPEHESISSPQGPLGQVRPLSALLSLLCFSFLKEMEVQSAL